jgi:hypothetical protein
MHVAEYKANRRLSNWDPDVFYKFRDVILQQVPTCTIKLRNDLCRNLPRVWTQHFLLDKDKDVAFEANILSLSLMTTTHIIGRTTLLWVEDVPEGHPILPHIDSV